MEFGQKFGAGILMLVPAMVGGGAAWALFHSWAAVIIWLLCVPVIYWLIISGKLAGKKAEAE